MNLINCDLEIHFHYFLFYIFLIRLKFVPLLIP